jgi:hypothetical protein
MLITIGTVTTRKGHKVHRHVNGWAACGAGRLIESPRFIAEGDQLCRRCAEHLRTALIWEIDDMDRKRCTARADMLRRFMDSGESPAFLVERQEFFAELDARLAASWERQTQPRPLLVVDRYEDILTLF